MCTPQYCTPSIGGLLYEIRNRQTYLRIDRRATIVMEHCSTFRYRRIGGIKMTRAALKHRA